MQLMNTKKPTQSIGNLIQNQDHISKLRNSKPVGTTTRTANVKQYRSDEKPEQHSTEAKKKQAEQHGNRHNLEQVTNTARIYTDDGPHPSSKLGRMRVVLGNSFV